MAFDHRLWSFSANGRTWTSNSVPPFFSATSNEQPSRALKRNLFPLAPASLKNIKRLVRATSSADLVRKKTKTLARSVAREISEGAGWRRIPAGLCREAIGLQQEGGGHGLVPERESNIEDSLETGNHMNDTSLRSNGLPAKENGSCENTPHYGDSHDELVQMVTELKLQNEFLKSHFEGLKDLHLEEIRSQQRREVGGQEGEDVKRLNDRIESLERELLQEKQTRGVAEEALKHLQVAHSEADARAQELSARLAEG